MLSGGYKLTFMSDSIMYIYVDESGCLRANQLFVAGAWFTWVPDMWLKTIQDIRERQGFWREMHFHKISNNENDHRCQMIRDLLIHLCKYPKTWYFRMIFVSEEEQLNRWKNYCSTDIYDNLMSMFFDRFGGYFPEHCTEIILDEKNRPVWDDYIPTGIEEFLNSNVGVKTNTKFFIKTGNSADNDLLQVGDVLTAAIRQLYVPSENRNKKDLANALLQAGKRIKIWDGRRTISLSDLGK